MKTIIHEADENADGALRERYVRQLVVKPIGHHIKLYTSACLKQGEEILAKIGKLNESVEIMARELARQSKKRECFLSRFLSRWFNR